MSLLCKLGLHKPDIVKKWFLYHGVVIGQKCRRCGKLIKVIGVEY
jgi:hypothetical protein